MARKTAVTKRFNPRTGTMDVVSTKAVAVADYPNGAGPKIKAVPAVSPVPASTGDHSRDLRRVLYGY